MPILKLQRQTAAFPCVGKLRKGAPKEKRQKSGKEIEVVGRDLSYFRFDSDDADAMQRFTAAYGPEPKQINIYLPYPTVDETFPTWKEKYAAGGLEHRCDGETCVIWQKPDGAYSQEPKRCPGGCKEVGRLNVIIIELARFAYVTAETHSIHDILELTDNLQAALALRGTLTGIPFVLSRRPKEISMVGDDGKRRRVTKHLLFLEPHPDWVRVQLEAMRHSALTFAGAGLPLPERQRLTVNQSVDIGTGEIFDDDDDSVVEMSDEAHAPDGSIPATRMLRETIKQAAAPVGAPVTVQQLPQSKPAAKPVTQNGKAAQGPPRASQEQLAKLDATGQRVHGDAWAQQRLNLVSEVSMGEANTPEDLTPGECNEALLTILGKAALGDEWPAQAKAVCENVSKERLAQLDQKSVDAMIARLEKRLAEQQTGEKVPA